MLVHYCQEFGWHVESCPSTCCGDPHFSLAVGHEDLCRLLNAIDGVWDDIVMLSHWNDEIYEVRKWMGTHEE